MTCNRSAGGVQFMHIY